MNKQNLTVIVLIVSVGLNLLLAGIMIGHNAPRAPRLPFDRDAISEATRDMIRQSMQQHIRETASDRAHLNTARQQLHEQLMQPEWDKQAVTAAFEQVRAASMALQASIHGNIIETLGQLSPQERAQAFQAMTRRGAGPRHGPPGMGNPEPPAYGRPGENHEE